MAIGLANFVAGIAAAAYPTRSITIPDGRGPATIFVSFNTSENFSVYTAPYISGVGNFTLMASGSTTSVIYKVYMLHMVPAGTYTVNWSVSNNKVQGIVGVICETSGVNSKPQSMVNINYYYPSAPVTGTPTLDSGSLYFDFLAMTGRDFSPLSGQTLVLSSSLYEQCLVRIYYKLNVGGGVYTTSYSNSPYMIGYLNGWEFYPIGRNFFIPPMLIG